MKGSTTSLIRWLAVASVAAVLGVTGCEKKEPERDVDINTPGLELKIDKTERGIEIEAKRKKAGKSDDTDTSVTDEDVKQPVRPK